MSLSVSSVLKSATGQILPALGACLAKGKAHAADKGVPEEVLLSCRLHLDMFPLSRQVQIATDQVTRGAARLAGIDLPSFPDVETTFDELIARTARATEFVMSVPSDALDSGGDRDITFPAGPEMTMTMPGSRFLVNFVLPNLYFHAATAYGLMRQNGVVLGKRDFMTPPPR